MAIAVVVLWIVLPLVVGSAIAKNKHPTEKGVHKDWKGLIDRLEIVEPFQMTSFTKVVVLPFSTANTPLPKPDDNTYAPTKTVLSKAWRMPPRECCRSVGKYPK